MYCTYLCRSLLTFITNLFRRIPLSQVNGEIDSKQHHSGRFDRMKPFDSHFISIIRVSHRLDRTIRSRALSPQTRLDRFTFLSDRILFQDGLALPLIIPYCFGSLEFIPLINFPIKITSEMSCCVYR